MHFFCWEDPETDKNLHKLELLKLLFIFKNFLIVFVLRFTQFMINLISQIQILQMNGRKNAKKAST